VSGVKGDDRSFRAQDPFVGYHGVYSQHIPKKRAGFPQVFHRDPFIQNYSERFIVIFAQV